MAPPQFTRVSSSKRTRTPEPLSAPRTCPSCARPFPARSGNQKYCTVACRDAATPPSTTGWDRTARECSWCGQTFDPRGPGQIYCNSECRRLRHESDFRASPWDKSARTCPHCEADYSPSQPQQRYCSRPCRSVANRLLSLAKGRESAKAIREVAESAPLSPPPELTSFGGLNLVSEEDFAGWFAANYGLFGIRRIVKLDRFFPDCRAEMFDGRLVDIELEYHASNFKKHGHTASGCDLVISYAKAEGQSHVGGKPILAVFIVRNFKGNGQFDVASRRLTPYFRRIVEFAYGLMLEIAPPASASPREPRQGDAGGLPGDDPVIARERTRPAPRLREIPEDAAAMSAFF